MVHIATSPGEILRQDYMIQYDMSANALAAELHVPTNRITAILHGTRSVTADTALRLARYFRTPPGFWLNLQVNHDLSRAEADIGKQVRREVPQREMASV